MYIYFVYGRWVHNRPYDGIVNNKNKMSNAIHDTVNHVSGSISKEESINECIRNCKNGHQKTLMGKIVEGTFDLTLNSGLHEGIHYSFLEPTSDILQVGTDIEFMDGSISSNDLTAENANLKLLAKYLTLLLRKNEAEKELYTIGTGKRQVYNSPTLVQLNKKIIEFKQTIRDNPTALKYFNENLDITL